MQSVSPPARQLSTGTIILEIGKLGKMNALTASNIRATRSCSSLYYDSLLANHMARSRFPTEFSGFMANVA